MWRFTVGFIRCTSACSCCSKAPIYIYIYIYPKMVLAFKNKHQDQWTCSPGPVRLKPICNSADKAIWLVLTYLVSRPKDFRHDELLCWKRKSKAAMEQHLHKLHLAAKWRKGINPKMIHPILEVCDCRKLLKGMESLRDPSREFRDRWTEGERRAFSSYFRVCVICPFCPPKLTKFKRFSWMCLQTERNTSDLVATTQ